MTCENCIRLTRELREALELIDEYERPGAVSDARVYRINHWLSRPCSVQGAKILAALLDAKGQVVPRDRLVYIIDYAGDLPIERILSVNISRLRVALRNRGLKVSVNNAHSKGYYIDTKDADVIRAAMERAK